MKIFAVNMTGIDPAGNADQLYYSSGSGLMTTAADTPPSTVFESRLISAGNFERHGWQTGATRGTSSRGFGVLKLANPDGALDYLNGYAVDGQPITISTGDDSGFVSGFTPLFTGRQRRLDVGWSEVDVNFVDWQGDIADKPFQQTKFLGTNVDPTGLEGLTTDLMGKPKPKLRGSAWNCNLPCVNTYSLIYQADDGSAIIPATGNPIIALFDEMAPITANKRIMTLPQLYSSAPPGGYYNYYLGPEGWYVILGSTPKGILTANLSEGALSNRTTAQLMNRILQAEGGVPLSAISQNSVTAMDAAKGYEVGFWSSVQESTVGQVLDQLADSVNAYWVETRAGSFEFGWLQDPSLMAPVAVFESWQIKDPGPTNFQITGSNDPGTGLRLSTQVTGALVNVAQVNYATDQNATIGLPCWRVLLNYDHNYTTMTQTDVAGQAFATVGYVIAQYRQVVAQDQTVLQRNIKAPEFTVTTQIRNIADATTEAAAQLALRKVPRIVVQFPLDPMWAETIDIGDCIVINLDRFRWNQITGSSAAGGYTGKPFFVLGMVEDYGDGVGNGAFTTLYLWG